MTYNTINIKQASADVNLTKNKTRICFYLFIFFAANFNLIVFFLLELNTKISAT